MLAEMGVDQKYIQTRLGHANLVKILVRIF